MGGKGSFFLWHVFIILPRVGNCYDNDLKKLVHTRGPVSLSVGKCVSFTARTSHRAVGNWSWRKDAIPVSPSPRVVIDENSLWISDAVPSDSAYYSAEIQTTERLELFKFWLTVKDCRDNEKKNPYYNGKCRSWCEKKCRVGWKYFRNGCYKYFGQTKSWEGALDSCRSMDAKLVTIRDKEENNFVSSLLESGEGAWIGLNDRHQESDFVWNNDRKDSSHYYSWAPDEPNNANSKCNIENCVEMKYSNFKWNDMVCNGYNAFVCQLPKNNNNVTSSWSCYGETCFRYFHTALIWSDSKLKCEDLGGQLARITSLELTEFVGKLLASNAWIGLNDIAEAGTYVWSGGKPASFYNWDKGEPNDRHYELLRLGTVCSGEDCVRINSWNNVIDWYDSECGKQLPYICKRTRDSLLTVAAIIGISVGCTAMGIVVVAIVHFFFHNRKHKIQVNKLTLNVKG